MVDNEIVLISKCGTRCPFSAYSTAVMFPGCDVSQLSCLHQSKSLSAHRIPKWGLQALNFGDDSLQVTVVMLIEKIILSLALTMNTGHFKSLECEFFYNVISGATNWFYQLTSINGK